MTCVRTTELRRPRGLLPLLLVSAVVVLVVLGFARGVWVGNLHNGLLALSFTLVGAYVLFFPVIAKACSLWLPGPSRRSCSSVGRSVIRPQET